MVSVTFFCHRGVLPSSSQRHPLTPETPAANGRADGLLHYSRIAVNHCFSKLEMAERFLEATKGSHEQQQSKFSLRAA